MARLLKWLFVLVVLAALYQAWWLNDHLPARLASHFDARGQANGWMGRDEFFVFQTALIGLLGLVFGGLGRMMRVLPLDLINLPHRQYWLAPERREETLAWLGALGHALGLGVIGFLMFVFQQVADANQTGRLQLAPLPLLCIPLVIVAVVIVAMFIRFKRPPGRNSAS